MLISANYKSTLAAKTNLPPDARLRAKVFGRERAAANVCTFLATPERMPEHATYHLGAGTFCLFVADRHNVRLQTEEEEETWAELVLN